MSFCDGTHSKGDPRHCTLNFYTKVQVWGGSSIHTKGHFGLKKEMMSTLPCNKKRENREKSFYKKMKNRKIEKYI
jgi:hypothetical protein